MSSTAARSKMTRWRAGSLIVVHLLAALHFLHWRLNGWTLAPVEPSEMFDTLHLGIITVGFLFMAGLVVATAIAGRFFCSWGCHILALQDLSAWGLNKLRVPTSPIRSRALVWAPPLAVLYLFVWPQVKRLLRGQPPPTLHVVSEAEGWTSFTTNDLLRSFPGIGMTLLTFVVCGFAIVYFLGSRSFCAYACPYGAIFAAAERLSPLRIIAGPGECSDCGLCTASCPSSVKVIEEVRLYGTVMNSSCMKDLDCVSVCPTGALRYGPTRPPVLRPWDSPSWAPKRYDFTRAEDALITIVFIAVLPVIRGLYGAVALLLALAFSAIIAYVTVVAVRLLRAERVAVSNVPLKQAGRMTTNGRLFAMAWAALAAFVVHSAVIQASLHLGNIAAARADADLERSHGGSPHLEDAISHFRRASEWGLVRPADLRKKLALLHLKAESPREARDELNSLLSKDANDAEARLLLAQSWAMEGRVELARRQADLVLESPTSDTSLHNRKTQAAAYYLLGTLDARGGDRESAVRRFRSATELFPDHADARSALGAMLATDGRLVEAASHFTKAVELNPNSAASHNNLAAVLARLGKHYEALAHYRRSLDLAPERPLTYCDVGLLLVELERIEEAERFFNQALIRQPDCAEAIEGLEIIRRYRETREVEPNEPRQPAKP